MDSKNQLTVPRGQKESADCHVTSKNQLTATWTLDSKNHLTVPRGKLTRMFQFLVLLLLDQLKVNSLQEELAVSNTVIIQYTVSWK